MADKPVQHNTAFDEVLKDVFFPEGLSLTRDRNIQAEQVFQPRDVDKWLNEGMTRSDLKDFDTTNAREPTEREIKSKLRQQVGLGYVESEPERFIRSGHETRKLLEEHKAEIGDYNSFKETVKKAWGKDRSLRDLVDNMNEADFEALFNTKAVQGWVEGNTSEITIQGLMQRFNIERGRAETVYNHLNVDNRRKILASLAGGHKFSLTPASAQQIQAAPVFAVPFISQKSRWGTVYSRAKPQKWADIQVEFINNNKQMPLKALHGLYNQTFSQPRSLIGIRNKRARLAP